MRLKIILFLITSFFLLTTKVSYSESIAYVDIDFIMNNSLAGKSITNNLESSFKVKNDKLNDLENELKQKEKNLVSQKNLLKEDEFKKKVEILKKEINNYKDNRKKLLNKYNTKKIESTKILLSKINPILADYSKENSIDIIFQKKNIVIGKKSLDITEDIINILNSKVKKIEIN
tara:strand:+ start:314 stop:838 length:525 start_codon:yes stop_codon:yes gene_type:complete